MLCNIGPKSIVELGPMLHTENTIFNSLTEEYTARGELIRWGMFFFMQQMS